MQLLVMQWLHMQLLSMQRLSQQLSTAKNLSGFQKSAHPTAQADLPHGHDPNQPVRKISPRPKICSVLTKICSAFLQHGHSAL